MLKQSKFICLDLRIWFVFLQISVTHICVSFTAFYKHCPYVRPFTGNVHLCLHVSMYVHFLVHRCVCSLTSVHVRIFQRTPSHPSHRRGLWRIRSRNRKCTSDRPTLVPGRLQSGNRHRCSAVKQKTYN